MNESMVATGRLSWSLCIPTCNRADVLTIALRSALAQTRRPAEIIVVDASDDWHRTKKRITDTLDFGSVRFAYVEAEQKSSAAQRNQAIAQSTSDVLMLFDDDSILFPDCAERILDVYEADVHGSVAGIAASDVATLPEAMTPYFSRSGAQDENGTVIETVGWFEKNRAKVAAYRQHRIVRWAMSEVLMMNVERAFIPYDAGRPRVPDASPEILRQFPLHPVSYLVGYGMTVRSGIANRELFNPDLLAYCPAEDLDASYRWGRHGVLLRHGRACLHHYKASTGRMKRREVAALSTLNISWFLKANSDDIRRHVLSYYVWGLRRLFAEFLKETLMRRWSFPQLRGTFEGLSRSREVFSYDGDDAGARYVNLQKKVLGL